ncbi:GNAT family N-acetyltransferase [Candidatus Fermentibacterales bacterium]|nr:GNAT family N-acetyltransferase [Candidatus Fermentibacterales bacterium]
MKTRSDFLTLELRDIRLSDLPSLESWGAAIDYARYMSRLSPFCFDGSLADQNRSFVWFAIVVDGRDSGTVWIERKPFQKDVGVLGILLARKSLFDRGIGRAAIRRAVTIARNALGVSSVRLHVRQTNLRAISCYRHCGFRITASAETTFPDGARIPFHRMELDLAAGVPRHASPSPAHEVELPRVSGK